MHFLGKALLVFALLHSVSLLCDQPPHSPVVTQMMVWVAETPVLEPARGLTLLNSPSETASGHGIPATGVGDGPLAMRNLQGRVH